jgi:hypothetical protein
LSEIDDSKALLKRPQQHGGDHRPTLTAKDTRRQKQRDRCVKIRALMHRSDIDEECRHGGRKQQAVCRDVSRSRPSMSVIFPDLLLKLGGVNFPPQKPIRTTLGGLGYSLSRHFVAPHSGMIASACPPRTMDMGLRSAVEIGPM